MIGEVMVWFDEVLRDGRQVEGSLCVMVEVAGEGLIVAVILALNQLPLRAMPVRTAWPGYC
jgi:hypothetical protein